MLMFRIILNVKFGTQPLDRFTSGNLNQQLFA